MFTDTNNAKLSRKLQIITKCRMARTHSLCLKLIKINQASPSFRSFPYQLSIQIQNSIQLSNIKSNKNLPKLLANIQHTLVCSLQFIVVLSNASPLSHFPYSFWSLALLYEALSTWNLHHVKALFSPVSTSTYSIGFPSTLPKSKIPTSGFLRYT